MKGVNDMTDTKMLRNAIEKSGLKYKHIAEKLGLSAYGLQKKIENQSEFKASELCAIAELLGLSDGERSAIFFVRAGENKSRTADEKAE